MPNQCWHVLLHYTETESWWCTVSTIALSFQCISSISLDRHCYMKQIPFKNKRCVLYYSAAKSFIPPIIANRQFSYLCVYNFIAHCSIYDNSTGLFSLKKQRNMFFKFCKIVVVFWWWSHFNAWSGLPRSGKSQGNSSLSQSQGKVREFRCKSGNFVICYQSQGKVRECCLWCQLMHIFHRLANDIWTTSRTKSWIRFSFKYHLPNYFF